MYSLHARVIYTIYRALSYLLLRRIQNTPTAFWSILKIVPIRERTPKIQLPRILKSYFEFEHEYEKS